MDIDKPKVIAQKAPRKRKPSVKATKTQKKKKDDKKKEIPIIIAHHTDGRPVFSFKDVPDYEEQARLIKERCERNGLPYPPPRACGSDLKNMINEEVKIQGLPEGWGETCNEDLQCSEELSDDIRQLTDAVYKDKQEKTTTRKLKVIDSSREVIQDSENVLDKIILIHKELNDKLDKLTANEHKTQFIISRTYDAMETNLKKTVDLLDHLARIKDQYELHLEEQARQQKLFLDNLVIAEEPTHPRQEEELNYISGKAEQQELIPLPPPIIINQDFTVNGNNQSISKSYDKIRF